MERCLSAIAANTGDWPYEIIIEDDPPERPTGLPLTLERAVTRSAGEYVVFLGNDCLPQPGWLRAAMECMSFFPERVGLVALNDRQFDGEQFAINWVASKALLPLLGGQFYCPEYKHVGCDVELSARCKQIGRYKWCQQARIIHEHGPTHQKWLTWEERMSDTLLLLMRAVQFGFVDFLPTYRDYLPVGQTFPSQPASHSAG